MILLFFLLLLAAALPRTNALISLRTSTTLQGPSQQQVHDFLATSENWPRIVLSSFGVEGKRSDVPMKKRDQVDEIFGLPPILPLTVSWTCVASDSKKGVLDLTSPKGVPGLAKDCRMRFDIQETAPQVTTVDLTMEYEPQNNIVGQLAIPVLTIDNALALKVLLPNAIAPKKTPLQEFESLMGVLYGGAGVTHLLDCLVGDSQLLVAAGVPPFGALPLQGQVLALVWGAVGPLAFVLSRVGRGTAGLIIYGIVEVACAALAAGQGSGGELDPFLNAVGVQVAVGASWLYSSIKATDESENIAR